MDNITHTEEDLFNKLRQQPIDVVDLAIIQVFGPSTIHQPGNTYTIRDVGERDLMFLSLLLEDHHWDLIDYLKHTSITWEMTNGCKIT
jgi:hypothetical protein